MAANKPLSPLVSVLQLIILQRFVAVFPSCGSLDSSSDWHHKYFHLFLFRSIISLGKKYRGGNISNYFYLLNRKLLTQTLTVWHLKSWSALLCGLLTELLCYFALERRSHWSYSCNSGRSWKSGSGS